MLTDIGNEIHAHLACSPHLDDGTGETSAAIDRQGYQSALLVINSGAAAGTPDSFTVDAILQDSADGSTDWQAVSGVAITTITAINTQAIDAINLSSLRRYVRCVTTVEFVNGTAPTIGVAGLLVLGGAEVLPAV